MKYSIPETGDIELTTIVLDLNGTLTVGGVLVSGVEERVSTLKSLGFILYLFSGDTRGTGKGIAQQLGIEYVYTPSGEDKKNELQKIGPETAVAIGNGSIDLACISLAKIGIVTLQSEGVHTKTLGAADIVVPTINDALDLLIDEKRLIATMRI